MNKETSSRVSSIAAEILGREPATRTDTPTQAYNALLEKAKILAGSCMSQDETPSNVTALTEEVIGLKTGIHPAPTEFSPAQIAQDQILHFFHYAHLPEKLRATSRMFFMLAAECVNTLPRNAERTVALRKLLEAKDAAVRANLPTPGLGEVRQRPPMASNRALGEPKEIGGHDEDRDGPIPFGD